jgi:hypothetical protein
LPRKEAARVSAARTFGRQTTEISAGATPSRASVAGARMDGKRTLRSRSQRRRRRRRRRLCACPSLAPSGTRVMRSRPVSRRGPIRASRSQPEQPVARHSIDGSVGGRLGRAPSLLRSLPHDAISHAVLAGPQVQ